MLSCFLSMACGWFVPSAMADFELKSDDRVVFFGDTLVQSQGFSRFVETFVRSRYPELQARFIHLGYRNERASEAVPHVQNDLKTLSPTVVVVVFGLYDPQQQAFDEGRLTEFRKAYVAMVEQIKQLGCRVILVTPPRPQVEKLRDPNLNYAEVIGRYSQAIQEVGSNQSCPVIDWFSSSSVLYQQKADGAQRPDRTRGRDELPNPLAHAVLAGQLLHLWKAEPLRVDLELKWNSQEATISQGQVEVKQFDPNKLTIDLKGIPLGWALPRLLPFKVDQADWAGAELCQLNLRLKDAPEAGVDLVWKSRKTEVSPERVSSGWNIAYTMPVQMSPTMTELVRYLSKKDNYRQDYWHKVRPLRPEEPELQEAYESHLKTLQLYEEGTEKIILRLPKTADVTLQFELKQQPETSATTQPAGAVPDEPPLQEREGE